MEMDKSVLFVIFITFISSAKPEGSVCRSPQHMELGRSGLINCDFGEDFFGVYWYNSTDFSDEKRPVIYFTNSQKEGDGYLSGEFDVYPNGSLIISNVSLQHDHIFTVIMFRTIAEETVPIYISVIVTVKPRQKFPTIDKCGDERVCLRKIDQPMMLYCVVNDSRPAVNLTFVRRTAYEDHLLTSASSLNESRRLHTSTIAIELSLRTVMVTLYVCKVNPTNFMENDETAVLVESIDFDQFAGITPIDVSVEEGKRVHLSCSHGPTLYTIWEKQMTLKPANMIAYSITWKEYSVNETNERFYLVDRNTLMVPDVAVQDEGFYVCVTGDGIQERVKTFNITVYVQPSPPHVIVDDCSGNLNCWLPAQRTGTLTCKLYRIRPIVSLQWRFVYKLPQNKFKSRISTVTNSSEGSAYDVSVSSQYYIEDGSSGNVTVECYVDGDCTLPVNCSKWSKKLDLIVSEENKLTDFGNRLSPTSLPLIAFIVILFVFIVVIVMFILWSCEQGYCCRSDSTMDHSHQLQTVEQMKTEHVNEEVSLMTGHKFEAKLATLKKELERRYNEVCETMKPLPNSKKSYCIDELYIDGGLEIMSQCARGGEKWHKLGSYHLVVGDDSRKYDRVIIQGDSGFGKTFLCRKMAYDWCTKNKSSPFGKVDILIYLHVRLLAGSSLSEAIRHHLLPSDTTLRNEDIKGLLSSASSIIVLDGYNRVPASWRYESSELKLILMNKAFQNSQVILTALPNCIPQYLAPTTKKIKLVGFSDKNRGDYICKRVARNEPKAQQVIKSFFKSNPEIHKFCHVPLLFVLLSHLRCQGAISTTINDVRKVTEIVHFIMLALNKQAKTNDRSGQKSLDRTVIDSKLAHGAFNLLINPETGFCFEMENLKRKVGDTLYKKYIDMGLLIEEHVFYSSCSTRPYQNVYKPQTEVKFYHSTFLEWLAAQKLSREAEHLTERQLWTILDKVNPFNNQYVFRFACGQNQKAAEKIVNYLQEKGDDYRKFAQVCIVEQKGGIDKVRKTVQKLCSKPVIIEDDDGVLHQRSVVQLLEIASKNKIRIEVLWLQEIPVSFNSAHQVLQIGSEIQLRTLESLQQLSISLSTQLTEVEFDGILEYVSLCKKLTSLSLRECLLPIKTHCEALSVLNKRHVSVEWLLPLSEMSRHCLNLQTGYWEDDGKRLTHDSYGRIKTFLGFDEVPQEEIVTIE